ncbi:MAG: hypothetical protein QOK17_1227 [Sphingomonadales bacterium]|jgi:hypothetical protein|nr:hypothetical protein [Sphingomonadales bacterium]
MQIRERRFRAAAPCEGQEWLPSVLAAARCEISDDELLLRVIVDESDKGGVGGEALVMGGDILSLHPVGDPFLLAPRPFENCETFNAALLVPTGVGAEIGGHAGDAGPLTKLLGSICDAVVTHPNVVNASDINEAPANCHYVEGSVLTRLLLGNVALQPVRKNRVLLVIDDHPDSYFTTAATNAANASRASYGLDCSAILKLNPGVRLSVSYSSTGRAVGDVTNLDLLLSKLLELRDQYDAVAVSSVIDVPPGYHQKYFDSAGEMVNPWGGVEAMLTHTLSTVLGVPTAHSPMFETRDIASLDLGMVDARKAAEAVSMTFLQCILKGLQRSPRIVTAQFGRAGLFDVTNVSCLVIPDGCLGVPTLAALAQGIPVIAVRENRSLMKNDLRALPWADGQLHIVENYWEAAGVVAALKAGIDPASVRRPLNKIIPETVHASSDIRAMTAIGAAAAEPAY